MKLALPPALVAASLLLTAGASGAARSSWLLPSVVSGPGAWGQDVAVDTGGAATIVWATKDGTEDGVVQAADRPPGGHFGAPQDVSAPGVWGYGPPDIGVDAAGNATVLWASGSFPDVVVRAASRRAGGSFGAAEALAPAAQNVFSVRVAVDAKGDAVAMWVASDGWRYVLRSAFRPAGGSFGAPEDVAAFTPDAQVPSFQVAIDPKGNVVAVWVASPFPRSLVQAAFRPADGGFGPPVTLAEATSNDYVASADVAIAADGTATAVWWNAGTIQAARRPAASEVWQPAQVVGAQEGRISVAPRIAVDPAGDAYVAWVRPRDDTRPGGPTVQVSLRAAGSAVWQAPETLSRPDDSPRSPVSIAAGAGGEVVVAWSTSPNVVEAVVRPPGGSFGPALVVSQAGVDLHGSPEAAVDPEGNATLVWPTIRGPTGRYRGSGYVQAAGYDAAGPQLRRLLVPDAGKVGARLRFSVAPLDVWSKVASVRWRFGDGAHAIGSRVTHVYRRAGSYRLRVTSTDALGHATTAARTLRIGAR